MHESKNNPWGNNTVQAVLSRILKLFETVFEPIHLNNQFDQIAGRLFLERRVQVIIVSSPCN